MIPAHVLIILENEAYPYDVRVRYEGEALTEQGYQVTCVGPTQPGFEELETDIRGVRVLRYPAPAGGEGALGYVREYLISIGRMGRLIRRVARERPVDVVLAASPPDLLVPLARVLAGRGTAVVFDHHDLSPELFERKFGRRGLIHRLLLAVEQRAFRGADVVIAPNESYAEVARSRGRVAPERLFVVRTAPHPDRIFPVEPRPELKAGRPHLVLWTGSMTQPQRTAALVGAADVLVNELGRQDITFGFVGPGDARPALEADLKSRGLGDYVVLPGSVGDELLRAWLATADVCVSADVSNQMNDVSTVTKVLDYMAMGRPIVQFPLREMSRVSGDATAYARENDSNDLAAKIAELLDDPGERERLGKAARARMLDGGMWPDQVPLFLDAIGAALSRRGPR